MSKKRSNYMAKADTLFSKQIRERDGACLAMLTDPIDCKGVLQCAHIITRSYKTTRCDPDNAVTLCQAHHIYFTHHPLEWADWVEAQFPGRLEELRKKALTYERVDWKARYEELKESA